MPPELRIVRADRGDAGRRLDLMLRRHLTDVASATRTRVQTWIENGQVSVNGTPVRRVSTRTSMGDTVSIALDANEHEPRPVMAAEDIALRVLYEDEYLIAVDKPAGLVVHPTYKHMTGTLLNALLWHGRGWTTGDRPSIVGRLDKLTSGIVVAAKSAATHAALQRTMAASATDKSYLAVVYGRVKEPRGEIDFGLRRDPGDRRRVIASPTSGVPSLTCFERIARVAAPRVALSLLCCRLMTGRGHQIRVHLAARGWPIVGDPTYGEPRWRDIADPPLAAALAAFPRQALHAFRLALTHPITAERLHLEAPVPSDINDILLASGLQR